MIRLVLGDQRGQLERSVQRRLVRIPRYLLHVGLDDLSELGVPQSTQDALRGLLADLPLIPDAGSSAQLVGPPAISLPCLAVLARHVGQGLRDHNLAMAHDRERLHATRAKLIFLSADLLAEAIDAGDERPVRETVLFVVDGTESLRGLLASRTAARLATFVTTALPLANVADWRVVDLSV